MAEEIHDTDKDDMLAEEPLAEGREEQADDQPQENSDRTEAGDEETLVAKLAQVEEKLAEQTDLLLRTRAELENNRRRAQEDIEAAHKYAMNKFLTSILPVKDNLEMAMADQSGQFDNLKFGVELTLKEFQAALNSAHVEEINPEGERLDPYFHQAMQTEETNDIEPNTIIRVLKKGYRVSDRLLRPALVVVSAAKKENE